jgi:hypothetical protein
MMVEFSDSGDSASYTRFCRSVVALVALARPPKPPMPFVRPVGRGPGLGRSSLTLGFVRDDLPYSNLALDRECQHDDMFMLCDFCLSTSQHDDISSCCDVEIHDLQTKILEG